MSAAGSLLFKPDLLSQRPPPDTPAPAARTLPCLQYRTPITQFSQFIRRRHPRQPGSQDQHLLSIAIALIAEKAAPAPLAAGYTPPAQIPALLKNSLRVKEFKY